MQKKGFKYDWKVFSGAAFLFLLVVMVVRFNLIEQAWFMARQWYYAEKWSNGALWLRDYRVDIEAKPLGDGISELSGLAYAPDRNTLFAVAAAPVKLLELSLDGRVLREIRLKGVADVEGIAYVHPGVFVITEERDQALIEVVLDDETQEIDTTLSPRLVITAELNGNKGFEGVAYDFGQKRLMVAKERDPMRIYEVEGFTSGLTHEVSSVEAAPVRVHADPVRDQALFVRDISGLDFDVRTGHLLVLSDESRQIVEFDRAGHPISTLLLLAGMHGLKRGVSQPEGVAVDADGMVYVVSEPNLFYRFRRQSEGGMAVP